jgi:hypothetical protein
MDEQSNPWPPCSSLTHGWLITVAMILLVQLAGTTASHQPLTIAQKKFSFPLAIASPEAATTNDVLSTLTPENFSLEAPSVLLFEDLTSRPHSKKTTTLREAAAGRTLVLLRHLSLQQPKLLRN